MKTIVKLTLFTTLLGLGSAAHAHPMDLGNGLLAGLAHPLTGLDHLLAILAVGLLAGRMGRTARWSLPLAFLAVMLTGGMLGVTGITLPWMETLIAASVVVFGLMAINSRRLKLHHCLPIVAGFALMHGMAHGLEMTASTTVIAYFAGFLSSSLMLLLFGMAIPAMASAVGSRART